MLSQAIIKSGNSGLIGIATAWNEVGSWPCDKLDIQTKLKLDMPQTNLLCRGVSILVYIEDFLLSCLVGTLTVADKLSVLRQLLRVSQSCRPGEMGILIYSRGTRSEGAVELLA